MKSGLRNLGTGNRHQADTAHRNFGASRAPVSDQAGPRFPSVLLHFYFLIVFSQTFAASGIVQTLDGRFTGKLNFDQKSVLVDGHSTDWSRIVYVLMNREAPVANADQVVWLKKGEQWHVKLLRMDSKEVVFRSLILGKRTLKPDLVTRIDFVPGFRVFEPEDRTLYRPNAEPVPGELMWIDGTHLAIDTPIGVVKTRRETTASYIRKTSRVSKANDSLGVELVDGSLFHGTATFAKDSVTLQHEILGKLQIPTKAIRSLRPHQPGVRFLSELGSVESRSTSPLNTEFATSQSLEGSTNRALSHLDSIEIPAGTVVTYRIPNDRKPVRFSGTVSSSSPGNGDAQFIVSVDSKEVLRREILNEAILISMDLPAGSTLSLAAGTGKQLRYPSGVLIADPMVVIP